MLHLLDISINTTSTYIEVEDRGWWGATKWCGIAKYNNICFELTCRHTDCEDKTNLKKTRSMPACISHALGNLVYKFSYTQVFWTTQLNKSPTSFHTHTHARTHTHTISEGSYYTRAATKPLWRT